MGVSTDFTPRPAARLVPVVMVNVLGLVPIPLVAIVTLVLMSGGLQWPGQPPPPPDPLWVPLAILLVTNFIAPAAFGRRSRS